MRRYKEKTLGFIAQRETLLSGTAALLKANASVSGVEEKEQRRAPDAELLKRIANAASRFKTSEIEKRVVELNMFRYESGGDLVELADGSERKLGVWRDGRKAFINHFKLETVPKPQVLEQ